MFHTYRQGAVQVIAGDVALSGEYIAQARQVCEQCFGKGQPRLVIDLDEVPLMDSAGLELLLDLRERCMRCGGIVHLSGPNSLCRDILQASGLANEFAIFDHCSAAVGSFAQ